MIDLKNFESPIPRKKTTQVRDKFEWWDYMSNEDKEFCIKHKDSKDKKDTKIIKLLKDQATSSRRDHCNALN